MFILPTRLGVLAGGTPLPLFIGEQVGSASACTLPGATGDLLILAVATESATTATDTAPTGWTLLEDDNNATGNYGFYLFWRIRQAGDTSVTYTTVGGGHGVVWAFRNVGNTLLYSNGTSHNATTDPSYSISSGRLRIAVMLSDGVFEDSANPVVPSAILAIAGGTVLSRQNVGASGSGFGIQLAYEIGLDPDRASTAANLTVTINPSSFGIALIVAGIN